MKSPLRPCVKPLALAIALLGCDAALAYQFKFDNGLTGSVDTTLSYGTSVRTSRRDPVLIGIANGGTQRSTNEDDGNLNFDKDEAFASVFKATVETEWKYRNFGFFGRGSAFYDLDLNDSNKLGSTGKDRLGQNVVGLDGFFSAAFEPFGQNLRLRAGRQVISWGESTFIPNGINVINPVDLSKIRIPGSELKEAFIPTSGLWGSQSISKAFSVEGFYLTNHDKIRIDPRGSYFSNNDFASDDATRVILSFGRRQDQRFAPANPVPSVIPTLGAAATALYGPYTPAASIWAPRVADKDPDDNGQYGIAFRYLADGLNNTEFGFYHINYHSRLPLFSGTKGTATSILTGGPLIAPICANAALRALCHTGTASYYAEYPEDIKLYGVSFNTQGPAGIALQGEYAYRSNLPIQYATPELLLAALGLPNVITGFTQLPGAPAGATAAFLVPDGTYIQGYQRVKSSQAQMTATKSMPNVLNAEQLVIVGEIGATWFHNLAPNLKFNGPAVMLPATALGAAASSAFSVQTEGFLTEFSWGYRLAGRLEYANALYGGTITPRVAFAHDVKGTSPTFNRGTRSYSFGASWDYQRQWNVDLQWTGYDGGKTYCGTDALPAGTVLAPGQTASWCSGANPLKDRDFYSISVSYAF